MILDLVSVWEATISKKEICFIAPLFFNVLLGCTSPTFFKAFIIWSLCLWWREKWVFKNRKFIPNIYYFHIYRELILSLSKVQFPRNQFGLIWNKLKPKKKLKLNLWVGLVRQNQIVTHITSILSHVTRQIF